MIQSNKAKCTKCGQVIESFSDTTITCNCGNLKISGGKNVLIREGKFEELSQHLLND